MTLHVYYGDLPNMIKHPNAYFNGHFDISWMQGEQVQKMLKDVDDVTILSDDVYHSDILGNIDHSHLSGGVKACILMLVQDRPVYGTACGDNCAKSIFEIGQKKELVICLSHFMRFPADCFPIVVDNTGKTVNCHEELVRVYAEVT